MKLLEIKQVPIVTVMMTLQIREPTMQGMKVPGHCVKILGQGGVCAQQIEDLGAGRLVN